MTNEELQNLIEEHQSKVSFGGPTFIGNIHDSGHVTLTIRHYDGTEFQTFSPSDDVYNRVDEALLDARLDAKEKG